MSAAMRGTKKITALVWAALAAQANEVQPLDFTGGFGFGPPVGLTAGIGAFEGALGSTAPL